MTEEENAEEYAKGLCKTCSLDTCRNNTLHTCSIKEYIKQAFLAGEEPREKRIAELEKENADFEKAYNETEELLDKQIEATYKLFEENKKLKTRVENQKSFLERIRAKFNLGEIDRKEIEGYLEGDQLTYAKTIIQDLLGNTDEYARQRAEDFLKENK